MSPRRDIARNYRRPGGEISPTLRSRRRVNRRFHSKGATSDALLAKVVGPTEHVRGALAVGNAVASCPIKSRGSVHMVDQAKAKTRRSCRLGRVASPL